MTGARKGKGEGRIGRARNARREILCVFSEFALLLLVPQRFSVKFLEYSCFDKTCPKKKKSVKAYVTMPKGRLGNTQ